MSHSNDSSADARADEGAHYRSAAVARMLRMPVATLRIWERRYQVAAPATTPAGHRLYSAADIRRLALLRQLTELGHAIGSLARLDLAQLQAVASTHARTLAATSAGTAARSADSTGAAARSAAGASLSTPAMASAAAQATAAPSGDALAGQAAGHATDPPDGPSPLAPHPPERPACMTVVLGSALARRLRRPALQRLLQRPLDLRWSGDAAEQARAAAPGQAAAELLLVQLPGLGHPQSEPPWAGVAQAWSAGQVGVLYRFAPEARRQHLAEQGLALLREPVADAALADWINTLMPAPLVAGSAPGRADADAPADAPAELPPIAPRRYDDATLADLAGLSSTIACECPRHLAELLMQLSHFEAYSAECAHQSPADARLHAYLQHVAAQARGLFEVALERVAVQEGLMLPR